MVTKTYKLERLTCPSCALKIEGVLKKTEGVEESQSEILFDKSKVKVRFDESNIDSEEIKSRLNKYGFKVVSEK